LSLERWGGASRVGGCSTAGADCDGGSASGAPLAASVNNQSVKVGSVNRRVSVRAEL